LVTGADETAPGACLRVAEADLVHDAGDAGARPRVDPIARTAASPHSSARSPRRQRDRALHWRLEDEWDHPTAVGPRLLWRLRNSGAAPVPLDLHER
jgi:hypothetical protein